MELVLFVRHGSFYNVRGATDLLYVQEAVNCLSAYLPVHLTSCCHSHTACQPVHLTPLVTVTHVIS